MQIYINALIMAIAYVQLLLLGHVTRLMFNKAQQILKNNQENSLKV